MGTTKCVLLCVQGDFRNGKQARFGRYTWANDNSHHTGTFESEFGDPHGFGTTVWPSGGKHTGWFRQGQEHGWGRSVWPNGTVQEGVWHHGERHGPHIYKWPGGGVVHSDYRNGVVHGDRVHKWPGGGTFTFSHPQHAPHPLAPHAAASHAPTTAPHAHPMVPHKKSSKP